MSGDTPCLQDREQWNDYIVMALLALLVLPPLVCTWSTWSAFLIDDRLPGVDVLRASSTIAVMAIHFGGNSAQFCPPWLHPMLWRAQDNFGVLQVVLWSRSAQHGALTVSGVGRRLFRKALRQTPACLVLYLLLHKFGFPSMHPARCYQEEVIGGAFLQCQYVQDLLAQIFPPTDHRAFTLWALGIDMQVTITLAILALVPRSVSSVVEVVVAALLWKTRFPWSHATRKASALYFDFGRYRLPMAVFVHQLERFFSDAAARYVVFRWLALVGILAFYAAELWQGSVAIGYGPGKEIYANMIGAAYHGLVWLCLTGFIHKGGQLTLLRQVSELSFPLVIVHRHLIRLALDRLPAVRQLHKDLLKEGTLPWACVCLPPLFLASFVCALILQRCVVDPWARVAAGSKSCHFFAAIGGLLYMVAAIGYYASWKPAYEPWAKSEPGF